MGCSSTKVKAIETKKDDEEEKNSEERDKIIEESITAGRTYQRKDGKIFSLTKKPSLFIGPSFFSETSSVMNNTFKDRSKSIGGPIQKDMSDTTSKDGSKGSTVVRRFSTTPYKKINEKSGFGFGVLQSIIYGQHGEDVSSFCAKRLEKYLKKGPPVPNDVFIIEKWLKDILYKVNDDLITDKSGKINCKDNGVTGNLTYTLQAIIGYAVLNKFIVANIGNCSGVLFRKNVNQKDYEAIELSEMHFPSIFEEKKRILKAGGRVAKPHLDFVGDVGYEAVWFQENHPSRGLQPGLTVSRLLGYTSATPLGVICYPYSRIVDLIYEGKEIVVFGTSTLWDALSREEILDVVRYTKTAEEASKQIVTKAKQKWEERLACEDVTAQVYIPGLFKEAE